MKVQWIGGPFDKQKFTVPRSQTHIRIGNTAMHVDLDRDPPDVVPIRYNDRYLPIVRRGWRRYVTWEESDAR